MNIPESKIAVTLFNLRDYCQTESDLDRTLDKLCAIGYQVVQVSGVGVAPAVIRKQLDAHNLYCCATHEGVQTILGDVNALCDKLDTLGCNFTALGAPTEEYLNPEGMQRLAAAFNKQGEAMAARGKKLGYHNHHMEFEKQGSSKILMEHFYGATDPRFVCAELDVHWVTRGGGSPVTWIKRFANRIPVIHFKDFAVIDREPHFCEIGEGNLDWPNILAACNEANVRFYSIEQDLPFPGRDIFDSMKLSFDNLHKMGVR